ncbi:hypothetical protein PRIEUP_LOCUS763, partial [Pristimantis euphronides]
VVIFSRSGESEFRWLVDILRDNWPVSVFIITNNNQSLFFKAVCQCSFGILYHSRNRGRVNIVDVTDSLYDAELKTMFEVLGKEKVVVVIDDLDDSSETAKDRILSYQHSLKTLTRDVVLFTRQEKAEGDLLRRRVRSLQDAIVQSKHVLHMGSQPHRGCPEPGAQARSPIAGWRGSATQDPQRSADEQPLWTAGCSERPLVSSLRQVFLAMNWAAVTLRLFCIHGHRRLIPLVSAARNALSAIITICTVHDTWHRPSALSVLSSGLWIFFWLRYLWPRRPHHSTGLVCSSLPYGLVPLTFWMGWRQSDVGTSLQVTCRFLLRSPAVLAAVGL